MSLNVYRYQLKIKELFLIVVLSMIATEFYGHDDIKKETVNITMKDGTNLASDIYIPTEGDEHPTILIRTPYGKQQHVYEGEYFAFNGYAVVIQDTRGKWDSEGEYLPFLNEKDDGIETIEWISEQEWSNGDLGMWGSSYLSYCAIVAATDNPPALKTIFVISGWLDGKKVINPGGTMHLMLNLAWILHEETQRVRSIRNYDLVELFEYLPLVDVFNSIGIDSKIWTPDYDIRTLNETMTATQINIPIFHVSGWNDFVCNSALEVYNQTSFESSNQNKLLIGPWFHDQLQTDYTEVGDEDFSPESIMGRGNLCKLSIDWFDHILKEKNPKLDNEPDVKLFVMGENKWKEFDQWPPEDIKYQKLYLSSTNGANTSNGDGKLSLNFSDISASDTFIFDPMNPVPTYGGANFHFFLHTIGVKDQSEIEERDDVLVYTTEVLTDTLYIIGPLELALFASSEGPDTDFTAKLVEVRENGYVRIIQEGIIRTSYRNSLTNRDMLEPGQVYEFRIDMGATAIQIPTGSRLGVEISSSNFPKYDRNPNTGEDAFKAKNLEAVKQTIYHGNKYPSYLLLPVLDAEHSN